MPSFGEKLKQERLKRSITLEQISISTKIGTRMLQALEEDKFSQLPGGIFNKGFVRAYARCLGLDEEQTIADYLQASGEVVPESVPEIRAQAARPPVRPPAAVQAPSRPLPWGVFAAILLLVALALSIWSRRQHAPERRPAAPATAAQQVANGSTSPESHVNTAEPSATDATPPVAADSTSNAAKVNPEVAPSTPEPRTPTNSPVPSAQKAIPPAAAMTAPESGQFTVVILAREDSWLSITADGKTTFTETLLGGEQRAVHARDRVVLKCGNTGALEFVFGGKKLPAQGARGEVKTLVFSASGLEAAATPPAVTQ